MALHFPRIPLDTERTLTTTTHRHTGTTTITANGRIDLATETPWHDAVMTAATTDTGPLVIDLTAVTHLSWASTAVLARAHRACTRRNRTLTVQARGAVLTTLQTGSLTQHLTIVPTASPTTIPHQRSATGWLIA
uniref:STAS domain-containing protein n=1 Tax=Actinokineospora sp. G85 TaxID=3406626 RepID=UPI003C761913